jgi:putative oxidoreductase
VTGYGPSIAPQPGTAPWRDLASLFGRVGLGLVFVWSGYGKFADMAPTIGYMQAHGMAAADFLIWPAALVEMAAGALLIAGWSARWAALALAAFTVAATLIFHAYWYAAPDLALNQQIQFMKNLAILGGLLTVFAHGSGRYSLDRWERGDSA